MPQIYDMGPTAVLPLQGRRAEDFFALKIRQLRLGLNPRTWVLKASTLPLHHRSRSCSYTERKFIIWQLCSYTERKFIIWQLQPNQSFLETMTANISVTKIPHITVRDNRSYHNYKNVDAASAFFNIARNLG